jgi:PAS domain S-box-containing protein
MTDAFNRGLRAKPVKLLRPGTAFPKWVRWLARYGLALLFVAASATLRWMLPDVLGPTPFLAFYLAWVGAAAFGGLGPGLLATAASWLCIDFLFDPTDTLINFSEPTTVGRLVVLLAGGLTVSLIADRMRKGRIRERESEAQLRTVVESLTEGLIVADLNGRMFQWNRAALDMYGFASLDEAQRRLPEFASIFEFSTPDGAAIPLEQWPLARILRGEELRDCEVRVRRISGQWERIFSYAGSLVRDEQGHPLLAVLTVTDVTERRRAEEAIREANKHLRDQAEELTAINRDLEQFAYIASHDLQEPLRAVAGFVTLLKQRYRGKLDEKADGYINSAVEGVSRMQALINGLLEYSRVGTRGDVPEPFSAEDALKEALENLQTLIQESGATITSDPLPRVRADGVQLTHVFQNLIANAIKFRSERTPEIQVGSRRQAGSWLFWVRDNGIGIEPQYYGRIFLIFQRLHTRTKYPGTGIGLAICKRIVERHGGNIWVESQPGQGSTFYFTLPEKGETYESSS